MADATTIVKTTESAALLDYGVALEAITLVVILSLIIERALALVFESKAWTDYADARKASIGKDPASLSELLKRGNAIILLIALAVALYFYLAKEAANSQFWAYFTGIILGLYILTHKYPTFPVKEVMAFGLALLIIIPYPFVGDFDMVASIMKESATYPGYLLTAAVIAGGSKGAIKLLQGVLDIKKVK